MDFSVRRGLAWMLISQGGLFVLQFGGSVAMARLLTPYEMGIFAVAYAIVGILGTIRAVGLNTFLIREAELTIAAIRTIFTINALLAIVTSGAIALLSSVGGSLLRDAGVQHVLLLLAVVPLFGILELVPASRLERTGAFQAVALVNFAKVAVSTSVTILMALRGFSYMSIAWGSLASAAFGALCMNAVGRHYISLRFGLDDWRRISRFGVQMLTISAIGNVAGRLSDLLLGRLVGLSALGLYSRASGLNGLLWDNVHLVIGRIVFVDFSERRRRSLPLRESYLRIVAMITALLWPSFGGMAILAGPVILTIYGPNWTEAAPPLSMLSLSALIMTSVTMAGEVYVVSRETDRFLRYELRRSVIGLVLFTLGCLLGLNWAAGARIVEAIAIVLLCRDDLRRMTQTRAQDFISIYQQSAGLTVLACAPTAVLMAANDWSERTSLQAIFGTILMGIAAWAAALWYLRHPLFVEAEHAGRQLFRRYVRGI